MKLLPRLGAVMALAVTAAMPASVHAAGPDDSLLPYAVHIFKTPTARYRLYGVYLGKGLVLTAAHVAGWADPWVDIAGKLLPSHTIKRGYFATVDLTLVQVDEQRLPASIGIRRMPICEQRPWPGEKVVVATPEGTARSEVISPALLPPGTSRFDTVIKDVATTGASGSGVFDLRQKCLLGIISRLIERIIPLFSYGYGVRRLEREEVGKYFVPASVIRDFIPRDATF
jgi:hypothetical protein